MDEDDLNTLPPGPGNSVRPDEKRPFLYNPDLAAPLPEDGVPADPDAQPDNGASAETNGHWLHDPAGPARYVPAPQDRAKPIVPDLQKLSED